MAGFNEILEGRFNRALQKLLGMKGPASMNELSTTLQAVRVFASGSEDRYLEGWDLFSMRIAQVAGGAGNTAQVRFRNPNGSNLIAVIQQIYFGGPLTDSPQLLQGLAGVDLTNIQSAVGPIDGRSTRSNGVIVSSTGAGGGFGGTAQVFLSPNVSLPFITDSNHEWPILPNRQLDIEAGVVNQALTVTIMWRERLLGDAEKA